MSRAPVAVIGAGFAGLTAARELRRHGVAVRIFEGSRSVAGLAASTVDGDGFVADTGAHFITNRLAAAVGVSARCRVVERYGESVLLDSAVYQYPTGLLRRPRFVASAVAGRLRRSGEVLSAADWFRGQYGRALADDIALPLVEAWSGLPGDALAAAVGDKIPTSLSHTLRLRITGRIAHRAVAVGYCGSAPEIAGVHHVYPEHGGVATLCHALAGELQDAITLESPVESIYVDGGRAVGIRSGGEDHDAAAVISTAPVHVLPRLVAGSTDVLAPLAGFRYRAMVFVNLRMHGRGLLPDVVNWIPDRTVPFFRLTEASQSMPWLAPPGKTMITADLGAVIGDEIWTSDDDALAARCLDHLARWIPDAHNRALGSQVLRVPLAYPVFALAYERERQRFEQDTGIDGLESIGRNGEFAHILMEDVYWRTVRRTRHLADRIVMRVAA